jgi:heterodisulfide reductase subunit C
MDYVQASLRGDIEKAAVLSFDCVQCGLCAFRCPAEITQYHVGQLARRLNGKFVAPKAIHTEEAVAKLNSGVTKEEIKKLKVMKLAEIKELYTKRSME